MIKNTNTDLLTQEYLDVIQKMSGDYFAKHYPNLQAPRYYVKRGRKYHRVVQENQGTVGLDLRGAHYGTSSSRSVHAFIGEDGMLYKAAGWKTPAKGARYNLQLDMDLIRQRFDPHGSYLYR